MNSMQPLVQRLCAASEQESVPIKWPDSVDSDNWFMSEELLSLFGSDLYDSLDDSERKRLGLLECVNFFSLNIHGERMLIEGLASRIYRKKHSIVTPYLHHFIDEENQHMAYFGTFCTRYAGKIYPDRKMVFPREYEEGEEDFLFFTKVMIFEELADAYNIHMALDTTLHPLARQINAIHHKDEARHLVFGRELVQQLFNEHSKHWHEATLNSIRTYLANYIQATFREYYNPDVYADFGFPDPYAVRDHAFNSEPSRIHRKKIASNTIDFMLKHEILVEEPKL